MPNTAPRPRIEGDAEERLRRENDRRDLDIGPWTATPDWHGERFDLHFGLWTLRGQYSDDEDSAQGEDPEEGKDGHRDVGEQAERDDNGRPSS